MHRLRYCLLRRLRLRHCRRRRNRRAACVRLSPVSPLQPPGAAAAHALPRSSGGGGRLPAWPRLAAYLRHQRRRQAPETGVSGELSRPRAG